MNKKALLFAFAFLATPALFGQNNYMDDLVEKSCQCVSELGEEEEINNMNLGLCIINEAVKYQDELMRDYNINMANIDVEGEELGRIVALEMLTKCPEQIKRIIAASEEAENEEAGASLEYAEGEIKAISRGEFIHFTITTTDGKTSKFYWLTFIQSNNDLQNEFEHFVEKKVSISYSIVELYDPNLGEYRNYNLIESLNRIE